MWLLQSSRLPRLNFPPKQYSYCVLVVQNGATHPKAPNLSCVPSVSLGQEEFCFSGTSPQVHHKAKVGEVPTLVLRGPLVLMGPAHTNRSIQTLWGHCCPQPLELAMASGFPKSTIPLSVPPRNIKGLTEAMLTGANGNCSPRASGGSQFGNHCCEAFYTFV